MNINMNGMSRIIVSLFILFNSSAISAQTDSTKSASYTDSAERKVYEKVEIEASFPGGDQSWRNFLERTIKAATPVENGARPGTYTVVILFVVDKDGNLSNMKALTHHGYGMEQEVLRVLLKSPKWTPAIQDGRQVKAYRKQPVTFQVTSEEPVRKRKNKDND